MPPPDEYLTIARPAQSDLRVKGSRFRAFAMTVRETTQADRFRKQLKRQYHDATHQPFAYRLISGEERSSDDGEPAGTSGPSILAQIQRADLYNVQVVVVRYFGGTKLGKGGLSRAFTECARLALTEAGSKKMQNRGELRLALQPEEVNLARAIIADHNGEIISLSYDIKARLHAAIPQSRLTSCQEAFKARFGLRIFN